MRTLTLRVREKDRHIFNDIRTGRKYIETRAATPRYQRVGRGDVLVFVCGGNRLAKRVTKAVYFKSIDTLVKKVQPRAIMPALKTLAEMKKAYALWPGYTKKIKKYGIVAWHIK